MSEEIIEFTEEPKITKKITGVVIGVLLGFSGSKKPLVVFPGNSSQIGVEAHTTTQLNHEDVGKKIALLFEGGDSSYPIIIGCIQNPDEVISPLAKQKIAELDGERLELSAKKEIVLKCGKSSITLTKSGKIILRGAYLLSRSSGVNRIKGGSVQIN